MKGSDVLDGKIKSCLETHLLLAFIVLFILLLAAIQYLSNGSINTEEEILIPFIMIGSIFIFILILKILVVSFFHPQSRLLLALLFLLLLGIELDLLLLTLPYPIATILIIKNLKSKGLM